MAGVGWAGGLGFESLPRPLRKRCPHKPQIGASEQPLLANTSLSNHLIFTSSVYTLADGFQANEFPLLLPWTSATASFELTKSEADYLQ